MQTLACWAARQTRACKFLREGKQSCASGSCLPNPNVATPTQLSDKESSKNAAEGGAQKHLGIVSLGQRLGVLCKHSDAGSPAAGKKRGGASSPAAGKRQRARADDRVVLGRCFTIFNSQENVQPFSDILTALPATWTVKGAKKSKVEYRQIRQAMQKQVSAFGSKHSWSRMGPESDYLKPHVLRKLMLLVRHVLEIDGTDWAGWKMADFQGMFPDVRNFVGQAPKHWWTDIRYFLRMAPEVSLSMHSCWACLAGYATNVKYTGNSQAFCDEVVSFIKAACEEASQDAARTVFEEARASLAEHRGGVQPSPLMIFRELSTTGRLHVGGARSPAAAAGVATAVVGCEGVAATPQGKRFRISSKSKSSIPPPTLAPVSGTAPDKKEAGGVPPPFIGGFPPGNASEPVAAGGLSAGSIAGGSSCPLQLAPAAARVRPQPSKSRQAVASAARHMTRPAATAAASAGEKRTASKQNRGDNALPSGSIIAR